jgi:hypothetical protein
MTSKTVNAIVKYNQTDGQQVLYYKTAERVVKMTNKKQLTRLHPNTRLESQFAKARLGWSRERKTLFIFGDEQPLLNGEPIELDGMIPFKMSEKEIDSFAVGAKPVVAVYKKRNMNVDRDLVRFFRRNGWTLQAIANHVGCSVSTVFRKSA